MQRPVVPGKVRGAGREPTLGLLPDRGVAVLDGEASAPWIARAEEPRVLAGHEAVGMRVAARPAQIIVGRQAEEGAGDGCLMFTSKDQRRSGAVERREGDSAEDEQHEGHEAETPVEAVLPSIGRCSCSPRR